MKTKLLKVLRFTWKVIRITIRAIINELKGAK